MQQINVAVPGFVTIPPPEGTHQIVLLAQHIAKEEVTSSNPTQEGEAAKMIKVVDSEKDFEVFDRLDPTKSLGTIFRPLLPAQISSNQESNDIPKAMVLQCRKDTNLLKLLESHA